MMKNNKYFHAIRINKENCTGCTKCVRVCPTEALRVRNGTIQFDSNRCIDCGNCIDACKYDAIVPWSDDVSIIDKFKYKVAILSTSFAGQFPPYIGYPDAKKALYHIGFDEVAQESMITEVMGDFIRDYISKNPDIKPIISSSCPAVVRLIQVRFTSLLPNLLKIEAPLSVLSMYHREKMSKELNLSPEEIGIFLIVPCIAQVTAVHQPEGAYSFMQDGAISIQDVYSRIIEKTKDLENDHREVDLYLNGLSWAITRMQAEDVNKGSLKTLAVNGIDNVIDVLIKIENQQIEQYDYVVLNSCINGCVGGVLNVENPFISTSRILDLVRNAKHKDFNDKYFNQLYKDGRFGVGNLEPRSIMPLDRDIKKALSKMKKIADIEAQLPALDCSACGSPTCRALAEDIVDNKASISDCVVLLRKKNRGKNET